LRAGAGFSTTRSGIFPMRLVRKPRTTLPFACGLRAVAGHTGGHSRHASCLRGVRHVDTLANTDEPRSTIHRASVRCDRLRTLTALSARGAESASMPPGDGASLGGAAPATLEGAMA
jgi:hypothetical protein